MTWYCNDCCERLGVDWLFDGASIHEADGHEVIWIPEDCA